jgi:hypothetical protein
MASLVVEFNPEWREVPTTCEPCKVCKDIIYGKQYQLFVLEKPSDNILCESCYMAIKEA